MAINGGAGSIGRLGGLQTDLISQTKNKAAKGPSFEENLKASLEKELTKAGNVSATSPEIKFSNHAVDRMRARGISFSPEDLSRIGNAVKKAADKGAREALILTDNNAMIANVKDNMIVTVMDRNALKENVFTNIDSAVVV